MSDPESAQSKAFEVAARDFFIGGGDQQELFERTEDFFCQNLMAVEAQDLEIPRNPQYTLKTLKKNRPEVYNLIVWMRLQFFPLRQTARIAQVCPNTVSAVDRELNQSQNVETVRELLAEGYRGLARLTVERLNEILMNRDHEDLDEGKLGNLLKHTTQMAELLSGRPTERIDWKPGDRDKVDYEQFIKEAIPIEAETHPGGEIDASHEAKPGLLPPASEPLDDGRLD